MVVPLARANNVSIMLTQFKDSPQGIRRAVVTGKGLSLERLSLLLQVCWHLPCSSFCCWCCSCTHGFNLAELDQCELLMFAIMPFLLGPLQKPFAIS
jgi:hypothetical protein